MVIKRTENSTEEAKSKLIVIIVFWPVNLEHHIKGINKLG